MKKMRKGFTLVELLIVVAILGVLSAAMTINMSGATAKAKAAAIKANFDICKTAAMTYYGSRIDNDLSKVTADAVMENTVPNWSSGLTKGAIKYTATGTAPKNWVITATYDSDTSAEEISTILDATDGITAGKTDSKFNGTATLKLIDELEADKPASNTP